MAAGSTFGNLFRVTTWGESHGKAIGAVIDGCPAGLELNEDDIRPFMQRRRPGQSEFTTKRNEDDEVEILSGTFEGKTTGTPISLIIYNRDQRSKDYGELKEVYRPGHADFTFDAKYGIRDYRGGGRSSARETAGRVAAGAVASKLLKKTGISCLCYTRSIGDIEMASFDENEINNNPFYMPDKEAAEKASVYVRSLMEKGDSAGGIIECRVFGLPTGLGEPVFDKLSANLAKAVMSIGAVKGFEIGEGFNASKLTGLKMNDPFINENGKVKKSSNHSGGTLGGISDGSDLLLRAAIKPTPSVSAPQNTVDINLNPRELTIRGRHDPVIVPRAVVVVESMVCLTLADMLLLNMSSRLDGIIDFYNSRE